VHLIPLYGSFQEWKSSLNIVGKIQAFVGVAENLNAIVIAFRGTQMTRGFVFQAVGCQLPRCY
jgi:hypothetical protein